MEKVIALTLYIYWCINWCMLCASLPGTKHWIVGIELTGLGELMNPSVGHEIPKGGTAETPCPGSVSSHGPAFVHLVVMYLFTYLFIVFVIWLFGVMYLSIYLFIVYVIYLSWSINLSMDAIGRTNTHVIFDQFFFERIQWKVCLLAWYTVASVSVASIFIPDVHWSCCSRRSLSCWKPKVLIHGEHNWNFILSPSRWWHWGLRAL